MTTAETLQLSAALVAQQALNDRKRLEEELQQAWRALADAAGVQRAMEAIAREEESRAAYDPDNRQEILHRADQIYAFAEQIGEGE